MTAHVTQCSGGRWHLQSGETQLALGLTQETTLTPEEPEA